LEIYQRSGDSMHLEIARTAVEVLCFSGTIALFPYVWIGCTPLFHGGRQRQEDLLKCVMHAFPSAEATSSYFMATDFVILCVRISSSDVPRRQAVVYISPAMSPQL